ncbi:flagellar calcium-binding protein [Chrysochromulina tobinii]|uniref:Flagellar calcium-binding protein n=1 Tax=Chrysochromulina tobinii TaxID=1460289 RepID=A0A0M0K7P8_9EUKA|nr:flagellar calcium-binding protein [Chrysochromulina tobinii]|eukprot:KOO34413.1 flagellar calcium-binding protein [Chrysochromulina sp. CCMP291]
MPVHSRFETSMPPDVPENAETDVAWREVARRTRMIAAQWKRLYIAEQSAAAEAKAAALQQKELRKKVEQDLNIALRQSEAAAQSLKAAVFEKKQWQDRSTAQQFSATYLELDATRTRLYETEASLKSTQRAFEALQRQYDEYLGQSTGALKSQSAAARAAIESTERHLEDVLEAKRRTEDDLIAARIKIGELLSKYPEGALEGAHQRVHETKTYCEALERTILTLQAENARWKDRARGALASERLMQLKGGMVPPGLIAQPSALDTKDRVSLGLEPGDDPNDPVKLRLELRRWRELAEYETRRVKAFQRILWDSDVLLGEKRFTQAHKLQVMEWLRMQLEDLEAFEPPKAAVPPKKPLGTARGSASARRAKYGNGPGGDGSGGNGSGGLNSDDAARLAELRRRQAAGQLTDAERLEMEALQRKGGSWGKVRGVVQASARFRMSPFGETKWRREDQSSWRRIPGPLATFLQSFDCAEKDNEEHARMRQVLFDRFDANHNGYISLAECGAGILITLGGHCKTFGQGAMATKLYHRFYKSYIWAFSDARDSSDARGGKGKAGLDDDDYVTRPEFRLLISYLRIYATWYEVFANLIDNSTNELVAQGKVKRDTLDEKPIETDNRIQRDEWEKALPMTRAAGETWAPFINLRNASAADFDVIDKNRGGHISFPEFCEWLEAAEIEAGTPFGLDLGVGE